MNINVHVRIDDDNRDKLEAALKMLKSRSLYVGVPRDHSAKSGEITDEEKARINEFGTSDCRIPARPFLRRGVESDSYRLKRAFGVAARLALQGKERHVEFVFEQTGVRTAAKVREYILDSSHFVPNAPSTLARKYPKDKPLIDTGSMIQSIVGIVVKDD